MGHFKFISKDILNIVSLRVWKSYLTKTNNEFKQVYFISFHTQYTNVKVNVKGCCIQWFADAKCWYFNACLHRNENHGPAFISTNGYKAWYKNGLRHRTNGPAIIWSFGEKFWYNKGQLHRNDGPAIEMADGRKYWYINGKQLSETEFNKRKK